MQNYYLNHKFKFMSTYKISNDLKCLKVEVQEYFTFLIITGELPIGSTFVSGPFSSG